VLVMLAVSDIGFALGFCSGQRQRPCANALAPATGV
jgi:hypothetical protein